MRLKDPRPQRDVAGRRARRRHRRHAAFGSERWYLYSQTALASAAFQNRPQLAAVLLNAGATADRGRRQGPLGSISSESPLYSAAVRGNYAVLKELLRGGASHVMTSWMYPTESLQGALKFC